MWPQRRLLLEILEHVENDPETGKSWWGRRERRRWWEGYLELESEDVIESTNGLSLYESDSRASGTHEQAGALWWQCADDPFSLFLFALRNEKQGHPLAVRKGKEVLGVRGKFKSNYSQISGSLQGPPVIWGHKPKEETDNMVMCFSPAFSMEYVQVQIGKVLDFSWSGFLEEHDYSSWSWNLKSGQRGTWGVRWVLGSERVVRSKQCKKSTMFFINWIFI